MSFSDVKVDGKEIRLINGVVLTMPELVVKAWYNEHDEFVISLLDYTAKRGIQQFNNLVAYSVENKELWQAELPTKSGSEAYVDANIEGDELTAFSFSCFKCSIDIENGKLIEKTFAK